MKERQDKNISKEQELIFENRGIQARVLDMKKDYMDNVSFSFFFNLKKSPVF